jgi:hypothetical protein
MATDLTMATDGVLKTIVFEGTDSSGKAIFSRALQTGYQIDIHGQVPGTSGSTVTITAEAGLAAVAINEETLEEIHAMHKACVKFIDHR